MPVLLPTSRVYRGDVALQAIYLGAEKIFEYEESAVWTPESIPGLALWLDASQDVLTDGAAISTYVEHSSAGRTLLATVGNLPYFRTGGGKPYIDFVAPAYGLYATDTWNAGTQGITFVSVDRLLGGSYPMILVHGPDPNGFEMRHDGTSMQIVVQYGSYGIVFSHGTGEGARP